MKFHWAVYNAMSTSSLEPIITKIAFEADIEERTAAGSAPGLFESKARPIFKPVTGAEHRAQIVLPHGFEYTVAEMGSGTSTKQDPIPLHFADSYAQFNELHINQDGVNREVNAVVREAETLAMCNFESDQIPPKLISKLMHSVAVVRPDRMPASPLNVFLDKAANRVICFRTVNEVAKQQWSAIYIDGATGGTRFADCSMRDFSTRTQLQEFPTFCLATAEVIDTLKGAYGHLPVKLITAPCWARDLLPT